MNENDDIISGWIDDTLDDAQRRNVEKTWGDTTLEKEKSSARRLAALLREFSSAPPMPSPEFFNSRILEEIDPAVRPPQSVTESVRAVLDPVWQVFRSRAVWGVACLLLAAALYTGWIAEETAAGSMAVSAEATSPEIFVHAFLDDNDRFAVLWVDGWEYISADHPIQ